MKNCVDTIREWVDIVISKVYGIELVYGINSYLNHHIVLVSPSSKYYNEKYMGLEEAFREEFYTMFPNEDLLITDDDSILDITDFVMSKSSHVMKQEPIKEMYVFGSSNHLDTTTSYGKDYALAA